MTLGGLGAGAAIFAAAAEGACDRDITGSLFVELGRDLGTAMPPARTVGTGRRTQECICTSE